MFLPMARTRSTNVLLAMKPSMKQMQMLKALPRALTLGGRSSATTTQMRVPYPPLPRNRRIRMAVGGTQPHWNASTSSPAFRHSQSPPTEIRDMMDFYHL